MLLASVQILVLALASTADAIGLAPNQIKKFVTFGDSYSDIVSVGDGGVAWPVYLAGYANLKLFPFARSGGVCSHKIVNNLPYASVYESQIPAYLAQKANATNALSHAKAGETLYTLWIGTNDIGVNTLLTGASALPAPNTATVVDTTECAVSWVKTMYDTGARNFIFQNMIPLQNAPLYSPGAYPTIFWSAQRNTTEWNVMMREMVDAGNAISRLMLQALAPSLKGAHVGLFDSNALFQNIIDQPALYLNGTLPLNVTGSVRACILAEGGATGSCTALPNDGGRDSYLWFDELHPSEQANRILARELAVVAKGAKSKWVTWFS